MATQKLKTTTETLLAELNNARGLVYPNIGYSYYADVRGDDVPRRAVYTIINSGGGVTYAGELNGRNPRRRCEKIREAIKKHNAE